LDEQEEIRKNAAVRQQAWLRKIGNSGIPSRFSDRTLESYRVENDSQKNALQFALHYAENFDQFKKIGCSAIFSGGVGTGKTHLAVGIAINIMSKGNTVLFTSIPIIMRKVKECFNKNAALSERETLELFIFPDLLIIDEIGIQSGSDFEMNFIFEVINSRYGNRLPTLFLTNLTEDEVKLALGVRIFDRLKEDGGVCISLNCESWRAKYPLSFVPLNCSVSTSE